VSCIVLLYHGLYRHRSEILGKPAREHVWIEDFHRQVGWLRENGYALLSLTRGREMSLQGKLPVKAAILTFDDGKRSDLLLAAPVLREMGAEGTFFVIPGWLGNPNIMTASEVKELAASGMEIGAHSLSHPCLTELNDSDLEKEVRGSRTFLQDLLGQEVQSFSYPYGNVDARVREAVKRAEFTAACTTLRGPVSRFPDWLLLRRWGVEGGMNLDRFCELLSRPGPTVWESATEAGKRLLGMPRYLRWRAHLLRKVGE